MIEIEITNWKGLSKIMDDPNMKKEPILIKFENNKLESLTFESYKDKELNKIPEK